MGQSAIIAAVVVAIVVSIIIWLLVARFITHTWPFRIMALLDEMKTKSRDADVKIISNTCPSITLSILDKAAASDLKSAVVKIYNDKGPNMTGTANCDAVSTLIVAGKSTYTTEQGEDGKYASF